MVRFEATSTEFDGLMSVRRKPAGDSRGFFSRFFCADEFRELGFQGPVAQINHTLTERRGTVRGLHFQRPPHGEIKVVSCLRGEVFDVAVDLRVESPTFLRWHGEVLSADNQRSLYIPQGFAHGFQTLTDACELVYLHSAAHAPAAEGALNAIDPKLRIEWPLTISARSDRDLRHPMLTDAFAGLTL